MFSLLELPKASQCKANPGKTLCRNLALNASRTWWEVDACEVCQRGRRYTWHGSWGKLFVSTRCSLLLFKSEDEQVLCCTGWVLEQIWATTWGSMHKKRKHMHTQICMLTHNTPWSIHYFHSMFSLSQFWYLLSLFHLCCALNRYLIDLFCFKTHKSTTMAIVGYDESIFCTQQSSIQSTLKSCLCTNGSGVVKVKQETSLLPLRLWNKEHISSESMFLPRLSLRFVLFSFFFFFFSVSPTCKPNIAKPEVVTESICFSS